MTMQGAPPGSTTVLDRYMGTWDFREVHRRRITARPDQIRAALLALSPMDTPLSGVSMALRLAPAALAARRWPVLPNRPWIDLLLEFGFVELGRSDDEVALGAVGRFVRERLEPVADAEAFDAFYAPGFAKGAMNFRIEQGVDAGADAVALTTETRVVGTDARARRAFRPYWIPVRAVGGLMRREMLGAIARMSVQEARSAPAL
jgi:hypothetical protein